MCASYTRGTEPKRPDVKATIGRWLWCVNCTMGWPTTVTLGSVWLSPRHAASLTVATLGGPASPTGTGSRFARPGIKWRRNLSGLALPPGLPSPLRSGVFVACWSAGAPVSCSRRVGSIPRGWMVAPATRPSRVATLAGSEQSQRAAIGHRCAGRSRSWVGGDHGAHKRGTRDRRLGH